MAKKFEIKGLKELHKAMELLGTATQKKVISSASRNVLQLYVNEARNNAPEDDGDLKKAIGKESAQRIGRDKVTIVAGPRRKKDKHNGYHAHLVEFGTAERKAKTSKGMVGESPNLGHKGKFYYGQEVAAMPAQPFLRPALDATQDRMIALYAEKMAAIIKKIAEKKQKPAVEPSTDD